MDSYYPDEYFRSLNGIFNGTISYRNDSFIPHQFYSDDWQYVESKDIQTENATWRKYKEAAVSKQKYVRYVIKYR